MYRPLLAKEGNIGSAFCAAQRGEGPGYRRNLVSLILILFLHIDNLIVTSPETLSIPNLKENASHNGLQDKREMQRQG